MISGQYVEDKKPHFNAGSILTIDAAILLAGYEIFKR